MESLWFIVEYRRTSFIYHGMMLLILYRKFTKHICCSHICGLEFPQPPTTRNHLDTQHGRIKTEFIWPIIASHKWFMHSVSWLSNCVGLYSMDRLSNCDSPYQIASWSLCTRAFSRWSCDCCWSLRLSATSWSLIHFFDRCYVDWCTEVFEAGSVKIASFAHCTTFDEHCLVDYRLCLSLSCKVK